MNRIIPTLILSVAILFQSTAMAERVKDMAQVAGVRSNQLVGYGLIVGLDGTGDQTSQVSFTAQSLKSMLTQLGVVVPSGVNPQPKNVAAVALHASLPAFVKAGQTIDVTASSIGNSKSLRGGTLLAAPLKGLDGKVYAIAQGNLVVGGLECRGCRRFQDYRKHSQRRPHSEWRDGGAGSCESVCIRLECDAEPSSG